MFCPGARYIDNVFVLGYLLKRFNSLHFSNFLKKKVFLTLKVVKHDVSSLKELHR